MPHDLAGVLLGPPHRRVVCDWRVEVGEVLADIVGVDRRPRKQQTRPFDKVAKRCRVVVDGRGLDQPGEDGDLVAAEVADEAEVEERDPPVAVEQVVARVGVAVERLHPVQAAEHEAKQAFADLVALALVPRQRLSPRGAGGEVGGQHPRRAERVDHLGNREQRVAAVEVDEALLVVPLLPVVELLAEPLLESRRRARLGRAN